MVADTRGKLFYCKLKPFQIHTITQLVRLNIVGLSLITRF